jgi:hypothetical protein
MIRAIAFYTGKDTSEANNAAEDVEACVSNNVKAIVSLYLDAPDIVALLHD